MGNFLSVIITSWLSPYRGKWIVSWNFKCSALDITKQCQNRPSPLRWMAAHWISADIKRKSMNGNQQFKVILIDSIKICIKHDPVAGLPCPEMFQSFIYPAHRKMFNLRADLVASSKVEHRCDCRGAAGRRARNAFLLKNQIHRSNRHWLKYHPQDMQASIRLEGLQQYLPIERHVYRDQQQIKRTRYVIHCCTVGAWHSVLRLSTWKPTLVLAIIKPIGLVSNVWSSSCVTQIGLVGKRPKGWKSFWNSSESILHITGQNTKP